jgi:hypothetical protein
VPELIAGIAGELVPPLPSVLAADAADVADALPAASRNNKLATPAAASGPPRLLLPALMPGVPTGVPIPWRDADESDGEKKRDTAVRSASGSSDSVRGSCPLRMLSPSSSCVPGPGVLPGHGDLGHPFRR